MHFKISDHQKAFLHKSHVDVGMQNASHLQILRRSNSGHVHRSVSTLVLPLMFVFKACASACHVVQKPDVRVQNDSYQAHGNAKVEIFCAN